MKLSMAFTMGQFFSYQSFCIRIPVGETVSTLLIFSLLDPLYMAHILKTCIEKFSQALNLCTFFPDELISATFYIGLNNQKPYLVANVIKTEFIVKRGSP